LAEELQPQQTYTILNSLVCKQECWLTAVSQAHGDREVKTLQVPAVCSVAGGGCPRPSLWSPRQLGVPASLTLVSTAVAILKPAYPKPSLIHTSPPPVSSLPSSCLFFYTSLSSCFSHFQPVLTRLLNFSANLTSLTGITYFF